MRFVLGHCISEYQVFWRYRQAPTQVPEQSLETDVDVLDTDVAPEGMGLGTDVVIMVVGEPIEPLEGLYQTDFVSRVPLSQHMRMLTAEQGSSSHPRRG